MKDYQKVEIYPGITTGELQSNMLEMLRYFMQFCRENDLYYWCGGGTMLGAVRHKGFIPWDDDIDVFMPRRDYEKISALWTERADTSRYQIHQSDRDHNYHQISLRLVNENTTFISHHAVDEDIAHGVSIDVIPFDGVPDSKLLRAVQIYHSIMFSVFNVQRLPDHQGKLLRFATGILLGVIKDPDKRYRIWKKHEKAMSKYDFYTSREVKELVTSFKGLFRAYPRSYFERTDAQFEGLTIPIPAGYDPYMKKIFGDYMSLPPESERQGKHNIAFMDLNTPYRSYRGIKYCVGKAVPGEGKERA